MRNEIDIYGVLVPALLVWVVVTYALGALLRPLLRRAGLYRLVSQPALFDAAAFVCLLGGVVYLFSEYFS